MVEQATSAGVSGAVVGSLVVLAPDFASYSDASGGPLKLGQTGVVVKTADTRLQVKPQTGSETVWWYAHAACPVVYMFAVVPLTVWV